MKTSGRWILDNIETILTVVGIGLLILAANLDSPSGWLLVSAWSTLALRVWFWFEDNKENEQKSAPFVLMIIPLFIVAANSRGFLGNVDKVLESPTFENLEKLASSSPFLFLVACYFALLFHFTKIKLIETLDNYELLNKRRLEEAALFQTELKNLNEKFLAELTKSSRN